MAVTGERTDIPLNARGNIHNVMTSGIKTQTSQKQVECL